ncbi:MAG TPA: ATP-binding protein [Gemmataceae bacterium]|nr:ATP-binding protein [Gemmataceae bacterium]
MFWRLFLTYLFLVVTAIGLVGVLLVQRDRALFFDLANEVGLAIVPIVAGCVAMAYILAGVFARPMAELNDGARRLAEGDLGHKIRVSGGKEHADLAATFNAMSGKLAATFAQLEHDREQFRAILSGMVEGVIAIDDGQRVLFANDRAGQLLDFDPAAAVDRKLSEVADQPAFQDIVQKGLVSTGPHREELDWKGPGVKSLAVYVSRFPGHGQPGAVVVIHDTTELRRLERMRQDFVANVSHELKTPLAVIKSNVEALIDGAAEDPDTRSTFLAQVAQESDRLEELIKDLLSLARIESGELGLELQSVPLDKAIEACLERHQTRAEVKTLTLVEKPPKDAPAGVAAWADPDALRQILDNLVDNAIKYTLNGGRITVRWTAGKDHVGFEVEDTGVGIPDRDLPRVFERFYRVDKARSRAVGGTGLGLAIVKHLVQVMKGQVRVSSQLGKGTTFKVMLPRAHTPAG